MSVLAAALISFFSLALISMHLSPQSRRRIVGYALWIDIILHGGVLYMFMGTSTLGLLQAELSAIFISLAIRLYRKLYGFERFKKLRWVRYAGTLTKTEATT